VGNPLRARLRAARRRMVDLETRLAAAARELDETRAEALEERRKADEANRARSTFLANMSHELRTPLNAVLGFAQLMGRNPALGAQDRESLAAIRRGGERLLDFVDDLLTLSKLETGTLAVSVQAFEFEHLLRDVEAITRARAEAKGLRFEVELDPSLPACVRGDADRLRQVLLHLLSDAVDVTDVGGVTFRAKWEDRTAGMGEATFEVEDTGRGMAPADMGVLFETFMHAQSGAVMSEGVGLGLALSRNLVLLMDGDIFASSEMGRGTVFTVRVPLIDDPCARRVDRREVVGLEAGHGPFRMLVVDDVRDDRALLAGRFDAVGFEVREVANGREAVEAWRSWRPHMIWMDARMRVMDGYEAVRRIRDAERAEWTETAHRTSDSSTRHSAAFHPDRARRCKIVAVATPAFEHEREAALAHGADDFRVKPLAERDVFAVVAEHLGVRYVYASGASASTLPESYTALALPERLARLPRAVVAQLSRAITIGDDRLAREIVEGFEARDPQLAGAMGTLLRQFRFDDIAHVIESIPPESR
jgi:signal transduction histidine kinase/DNA-binding response OmpR family regulator